MTRGRWILGVVGLAGAWFGGFTLVTTLRPDQLLGLAIWLACAVVAHDAILVPLVQLLSDGLDRTIKVPRQTRSLIRLGLVVGSVITLVVMPEIYAQSRGPANPTILVGDYALRLAITWVVIGMLIIVGSAISSVCTRRKFDRHSSTLAPSADQPDPHIA